MTIEELKQHCKKQVKMCVEWAEGNGREPSGKIYEEHKLILDLIKALEQQPSDCKIFGHKENCIGGATENECNHCDYKIQTLEQQPSDDCVDRNHIIATISQHHFDKDKDNFDLLIHNLCKEAKKLPPVTPAHGTCKDCKHNDSKNNNMCRMGHRFALRESEYFYCADFKKRGSENEVN